MKNGNEFNESGGYISGLSKYSIELLTGLEDNQPSQLRLRHEVDDF